MKIPPVAADLFRAVAPVLGTALGGPLGGTVAAVAVKALDQWVVPRGPGPPTPEELVEAVEKNANDPQLALDLKRAELAVKDYELRMKKLDAGFDLRRLEQLDRADARASARDTGLSRHLFFFGMGFVGLTILSLFGVVGFAVWTMKGGFVVTPENVTVVPVVFTLIGNVVTALVAVMTLVLGFYYGSSAGSKAKDAQFGGVLEDLGTALADRAQATQQQAPVILNNLPAQNRIDPPTIQEGAWHQGPHGGRRWRLTAAGVVPEGEAGPMRTVGQPATVRRVWREFGHHIAVSCARNAVPLELVVACIGAEGGLKPRALLVEGDGRRSAGPMQTLLGTASEMMGGTVTEEQLYDPAFSIEAGTRYIAHQRRLTDYQPPLVAAAYNAGGLYPPREGDDNPWRLRSTNDHISRFCQFFGDACAVAAEEGWQHTDKAA